MLTPKTLIISSFVLMIQQSLFSQWATSGTNIYNTNSGNVGIGTSSPAQKLSVNGNVRMESGYELFFADNGQIRSLDDNHRMLFRRADNKMELREFGTIVFSPGATSGTETAKMSMFANGNMAIGRSDASYKLDILTTQANEGIRIASGGGFALYHSNSLGQGAWNGMTQAGDAGIIYGTANETTSFGFVIAPWINATSGLRVDKDGNVGISTFDTKGYKLAVNGNAIFTKIVVKAYPWPDYVFHATYHLRPLSEVEQYIQQNHHLPEVPSEEEVKKDGLDLGENQAVLLKKVEELTLYLIDQNKKLQELEQRLNQLQGENGRLKEALKEK